MQHVISTNQMQHVRERCLGCGEGKSVRLEALVKFVTIKYQVCSVVILYFRVYPKVSNTINMLRVMPPFTSIQASFIIAEDMDSRRNGWSILEEELLFGASYSWICADMNNKLFICKLHLMWMFSCKED